MKDEEKNLIENLFHRLKNTELNSSERDRSADELITKLVHQQPASSYYMVQTILIQETVIKKMSADIEELKKTIKQLNLDKINKKSSFLSGFFKKNNDSETVSQNSNIWKKQENLQTYNPTPTTSSVIQASPVVLSNKSSGFLSNALQTATGVAGGMILGNILMNAFNNHNKPEEEVFDTIHKSSVDYNTDEHTVSGIHEHDLVKDEYIESDFDVNNDAYETDDIDINNDNFI